MGCSSKPWDWQYAPEKWDAKYVEKYGTPDIYFMRLKGGIYEETPNSGGMPGSSGGGHPGGIGETRGEGVSYGRNYGYLEGKGRTVDTGTPQGGESGLGAGSRPAVTSNIPKEFQNKPYTGLRPGTPDWMDVWRKHPELQEEMLSYAKIIGWSTGLALLCNTLNDDEKIRLFPVVFGSLLLRSPFPFEKANIITSISKVKSHPEYLMAKSGNWKSAINLAKSIFNPEKVEGLIKENPDAILIPVMEKEAQGTNAIPKAIATAIKDHWCRAK